MIDELLDTVEPLVQKNDNTLTVNCGVGVGTMTADLMKTRQILLNLLSNAAKFTRAGTIVLDVQPLRGRGPPVDRVHRDGHRRRHDARAGVKGLRSRSRRLT